jgi:hypothetical protein
MLLGSPVTTPAGTDLVSAASSTKGYAKWFFDDVQVGNTLMISAASVWQRSTAHNLELGAPRAPAN